MTLELKDMASSIAIAVLLLSFSCARKEGNASSAAEIEPPVPVAADAQLEPPPQSIPNLQAELLDDRNKTSDSPLATLDFKNYTYPLPRGWQNPDGSDLTLINGRVQPIAANTNAEMSGDEKAEAKAKRRIGMSYVTTKYLDVTADGRDEAIVILKIETAGSAIPQLVYVFTWKDDRPELIWPFRTGDRADGGLKDLRAENGDLVVELYGQDRFLLGATETGKITGDEEQLCCPNYFTRTYYKWNGKSFLMQGKRLTYSVADPTTPPQENLGDLVNKKENLKKYK